MLELFRDWNIIFHRRAKPKLWFSHYNYLWSISPSGSSISTSLVGLLLPPIHTAEDLGTLLNRKVTISKINESLWQPVECKMSGFYTAIIFIWRLRVYCCARFCCHWKNYFLENFCQRWQESAIRHDSLQKTGLFWFFR